jgi:hypothetical protein
VFTLPPLKRQKKSLRRWLRELAIPLLPIVAIVGVAAGWMVRGLWPG